MQNEFDTSVTHKSQANLTQRRKPHICALRRISRSPPSSITPKTKQERVPNPTKSNSKIPKARMYSQSLPLFPQLAHFRRTKRESAAPKINPPRAWSQKIGSSPFFPSPFLMTKISGHGLRGGRETRENAFGENVCLSVVHGEEERGGERVFGS